MAVKIRLARKGRHKRPFYRMVVADSQSPRDGKFIEILGTVDPLAEKDAVQLEEDRVIFWLNKGAKASDTVRSILKKTNVLKTLSEQKATQVAQ